MTMTGKHPGMRAFTSLGAGAAMLAAMVLLVAGPARASAGGHSVPRAGGSAGSRPQATAPQLTANTNAPCNAPQRHGFARCLAIVRTPASHRITPDTSGPPRGALGPADIQSAYSLPSATAGQGQTVAIVDAYGDSQAETDLAAFRSHYGLPACTTANGCFEKVNQEGQQGPYPPDNTGWAVETSLDLDAVSSACPNCHILLVEANTSSIADLGAAADEAVALGAKYVSNSYSVPGEFSGETSYDHYYDHPGVAVAAASGDEGYGEQGWPAAIPDVTAVGGTTLTKDAKISRGWAESAWSGGGSGCSPYEPKPAWQQNLTTDCANRAQVDISADANPASGLAVYDTDGYTGWLQVGGTSLATPLLAAMYALAGTPLPGTYPVSYPYDPTKAADLNDITTGSNGSCPNAPVLCNAGPGWDGPTGLGTPDGVGALSGAPHGDIAGQVTSAATGKPLAGATVSTPQGYTVTTGANGGYDLNVATGSYDVTASAFGYAPGTVSGVQVSQGKTTTENFALATVPYQTVSGKVSDGSGHRWPVYAKITIAGDPNGPVYTSPFTGTYSVSLPQDNTYQLQVTPVTYPGYATRNLTVQLGTSGLSQNIRLYVNGHTCSAPGYAFTYNGTTESFTGWTGRTPQDGWTVTDNNGSGQTWQFTDGNRPPIGSQPPGGDSDYAVAYHSAPQAVNDTSLVSPAENLSADASPVIALDTLYPSGIASSSKAAEVELSLDGGQTWTAVWKRGYAANVSGYVAIPIPQAAHQADVRVSFRFTAGGGLSGPQYWSLDNVFIGNRACVTTPGGIVAGIVHDNNTGGPVNGAAVTSSASPPVSAVSAVTGDPALPGGFYWMLSPQVGSQQFSAADDRYVTGTAAVTVTANAVTRQDWTLQAGHLTVTKASVSATETLGQSKTVRISFGNDGTSPVQVTLGPQDGGFAPAGGKPAAPSWTGIAPYPTPIERNAVAYNDGSVYSVGGDGGLFSSLTSAGYVYGSAARQWALIAPAPAAVESAGAAFVNGTMYLIGGRTPQVSSAVYAYDPASNSWSQVAALPAGVVEAGVAVLNGEIYVVGGCNYFGCADGLSSVYRYDPSSNTWEQLPGYPIPVDQEACAGIDGEIVCAGGLSQAETIGSTYIYHPDTNTWTQGADMSYVDQAMAYAGSHGKLQVADGTGPYTQITNQASQYDPATNKWTALPNTNNSSSTVNLDNAEQFGGGACGFYEIGGDFSNNLGSAQPTSLTLPGYGDCSGSTDNVPWLSAGGTGFTVAPGKSVTVAVTLDSSRVAQPGTYTADLAVGTDTPYLVPQVNVTLHVKPPVTWGELKGTVTDAITGKPIAGATVQAGTLGGAGQVSYTLTTNGTGSYFWWLDKRYNPLQVIAARNGYAQQVKDVRIRAGTATILNFALQETSPAARKRVRRS